MPQCYSKDHGKPFDVRNDYSYGDLLEYPEDTGVITVRHEMFYGGSYQVLPLRCVILFHPTGRCHLACFLDLTVISSVSTLLPPRNFSNSNLMDNTQKAAADQSGTKVRSGSQNREACTSQLHLNCATCRGPHAESYGSCPKKQEAYSLRKHNISFSERHHRSPPTFVVPLRLRSLSEYTVPNKGHAQFKQHM